MKKRLAIIGLVAIILLLGVGYLLIQSKPNASEQIDYDNQKKWSNDWGKAQSPINIPSASAKKMTDQGNLYLQYSPKPEKIIDNGHSIEVVTKGTANINKRDFELEQFHFHGMSEHTLNNVQMPMEVHFVHKAQDGRLAIIAVFMVEGKENNAFQSIMDQIDEETIKKDIDLTQLLPKEFGYYHYLGSLTTPPLTENVEWYVMKKSVEISSSQIEEFYDYYDHNNRDIQPLNRRPILEHSQK